MTGQNPGEQNRQGNTKGKINMTSHNVYFATLYTSYGYDYLYPPNGGVFSSYCLFRAKPYCTASYYSFYTRLVACLAGRALVVALSRLFHSPALAKSIA